MLSENTALQLLRNMAGIIVHLKNLDSKIDVLLIEVTALKQIVTRDITVDYDGV